MEDVREILLERLAVIEERYEHYTNNPFEAEHAHQLRVGLRELRGLLNFLKEIIGQEAYDRINDPLRDITHIFEDVRELDVLTDICRDIAREYPQESKDYYLLFHELDIQRRKAMKKTFNKTNSEFIETALSEVKQDLKGLVLNLEEDWGNYVSVNLKEKYKDLKQTYKERDITNYEETHNTRIKAKKVRYAAKYYKDISAESTKKYYKKAKKIQTELGEIVDAHVNIDILNKFIAGTENKKLQKLFKHIMKLEEFQLEEETAE